ncbi:ATPase domain-containing protein [Haloarcula nitratireducens]|uniref:non-specific serine/threonine protein kinase n=1 Tax=Haloarcula nitratireducens TaxID=2487749 RepID=A0AAW4PIH3_9EURY|nr:ATPase domain-containing protein [Halomicroarcula nitratireducens]MBX0298221.1 AAA family ATPase [Halomicroarcula nitratireducens]
MGIDARERYSSGIPGLDSLLRGGFVAERIYLVLGSPGTGKTLLGSKFLSTGLENDENVLFIHGEESRADLCLNAEELGINLDGVDFLDLGPESDFFSQERTYDLVNPQDVEYDSYIADIRGAVEDVDPDRVLIDPISQLQYVETTEYQFRKRMIAFMRFLKDRGTTVLATKTTSDFDDQLQSLSDGIIILERGEDGRRIDVVKHRGVGSRSGTHGMAIRGDGVSVFPSLIPEEHDEAFNPTQIASGIDGFDSLFGGGIERGTVTILSGPSGVGKSSTAAKFLESVASNDRNAVAYLFEESTNMFVHRSETFGIPVTELCDQGTLTLEPIDPLTQSAEEFGQRARAQVEEQDAELVVIDGINGYQSALYGETDQLARKLHALTRYLKNKNVAVVLIDEIGRVTGLQSPTSSDISYIADNIMFLKYIELDGRLKRVAGVVKKRIGGFEDTFREFTVSANGIDVGEPITNVRGILNGTPEWIQEEHHLNETDTYQPEE